jgi:hypothetical protein
MGGLSRRTREKRAYSLTLVTGGASIAAVVFLVTAVVGVTGIGPFLLAVIVAAVGAFLLRGTLRS